jgi:mono/diheme cytochrome c family protein
MSSENEKNLDYESGTASVVHMHDAVRREKELLPEGNDGIGITLLVVSCFMFIFGGGYFFSYANHLKPSTVKEFYTAAPRPSDDGGEGAVDVAWIEAWMKGGKKTYMNCIACHQASGSGSPGQYPPLKGSEWVNGGTKRLGAILMRGISGPFKVSGQSYNQIMQPWNSLSDKQIAQVLTYVRRTFAELPEGNDGVVTEEMIVAARKEYAGGAAWTEAGLLAIPVDANLLGAKVDLQTGEPIGAGGEEGK